MRVLIITGRFGLGHTSVANTLAKEINKVFPGSSIIKKDFFEYVTPGFHEILYNGYGGFVNNPLGSRYYNFFYKKTEFKHKSIPMIFNGLFFPAIHRLVQKIQPDIIICTLPYGAQVFSAYKGRYNCSIPLITCITDIGMHNDWINPHTDIYLVATSESEKELASRGIDPQRIFVTGIPVREQFRPLSHKKDSLEKRLLIMGGGMGILPKSRSFYTQINAFPQVKTTVITGNNKRMYRKLYGKYPHIEVIGFTDKVHQYMQNADLIISKPGGITLFETIHAELPIVVFKPTLQQETKNARIIESLKIGRIFWNKPADSVRQIYDLLNDDAALSEIRSNMQQLKDSLRKDVFYRIMDKLNIKGASA